MVVLGLFGVAMVVKVVSQLNGDVKMGLLFGDKTE